MAKRKRNVKKKKTKSFIALEKKCEESLKLQSTDVIFY